MTSEKKAGAVLVVTGVATIVLMAQHPSGSDSDLMITGVHGGLLLVLVLQVGALLFLLARRELAAMIASTFYAAGMLATVGAGVLNGFVFPALRRYENGEIGHDIFDLVWASNQALAELGVIGVGIAFACWSVGLWRGGEKPLAAFGWLAGLAPALLIASGVLGMDLHGALIAYALHALWVIALGWARWRG